MYLSVTTLLKHGRTASTLAQRPCLRMNFLMCFAQQRTHANRPRFLLCCKWPYSEQKWLFQWVRLFFFLESFAFSTHHMETSLSWQGAQSKVHRRPTEGMKWNQACLIDVRHAQHTTLIDRFALFVGQKCHGDSDCCPCEKLFSFPIPENTFS